MSWFEGIVDESVINNAPEEQGGSFEPLPQGNYNVVVDKIELKDTKAGTGKYLSATLKVLNGEHKNRLVWDNLNIKNPNPQAQEIGLGRLKRMYKLAGLGELKDNPPTALIGKQFCVFVNIKIFNSKESNNVASYDMPHDLNTSGISDPKNASAPNWM